MPTYPQTTKERNTYYFVAMLYWDIWKYSNGTWTTNGYPNGPMDRTFPYNFNFPGRKIVKVTAKEFNPNETVTNETFTEEVVFDNTRNDRWAFYKDRVSTGYRSVINQSSIVGYNTDTVKFDMRVTGRINAIHPDDLTVDGDFADGVEGWRHYYPTLITVELAPMQGKAIVKHFDTEGNSLDGVEGIRDREEKLEIGKDYSFTHPDSPKGYTYEGHKKSTKGPPSSGNDFTDGDPPKITKYDGSYDYYVYFYYKKSNNKKVIIKHFNTVGKSLNGVGGLKDTEKTLEVGKDYEFKHSPAPSGLTYEGYKDNKDAAPPLGGSFKPGDPPKITKFEGKYDYYVYYYYEGEGDPDPPDPPDPVGKCEIPRPGQKLTGKEMDPYVAAQILADHLNNSPFRFDETQGIPTSEYLLTKAIARNYLFQNTFTEMYGTCTFDVPVTQSYLLTWTEMGPPAGEGAPPTPIPMQDIEVRNETIQVKREYKFWKIDNLEVYQVNRATITNYALPNGGVQLLPQGYTPPYYSVATSGGIVQEPVPQLITLPQQPVPGGATRPGIPNNMDLFKSEAEKSIKEVQVRNDTLTFNGQTIMDGSTAEKQGPTPGSIPAPAMIHDRVLYLDHLFIDSHKVNKANNPSVGTIYYNLMPYNVNGGSDKQYPIYGINSVTVHTPVVIYAQVTNDKPHNQKTEPNPERAAFILDRPVSVYMPTKGQHLTIPGYGDRDYAKYYKSKEVRFPFDIYSADKSTFYPKNTWIHIPVSQEKTDFFLPVWVDEGNYTVSFRVTAENAPSSPSEQQNANTNIQHHRAVDTVPVEVIGRVYDFRVTDIMDFNWEMVFRKEQGRKEHTGNYFWVGDRGIDGELRGNHFPFVLPIRKGSHLAPSYKNVAVKTGYAFKFDLKSKGNMYGAYDSIRITPTFTFVDANGKKRQDVDLYYHTEEKKFVRIGSADDKVKRSVVLDARLRNIEKQDMVNTAAAFYNLHLDQMLLSQPEYIDAWLKRAKKKTEVGGYSHMKLPEGLRTFLGPLDIPKGVDASRAFASIQQWYGEFNLPSRVYVVPKGFDLSKQFSFDDQAPFFLKDGFIIINFNIETIRNGKTDKPHLQYINAPLTNQWKREGGSYSFTDPYGATFQLKDGDVLFYHANKASVDDFRVTGTH